MEIIIEGVRVIMGKDNDMELVIPSDMNRSEYKRWIKYNLFEAKRKFISFYLVRTD